MLILEAHCQSGVSSTFKHGASACTDPGTAECLVHSNQGFMSRDQDFIGDPFGQ